MRMRWLVMGLLALLSPCVAIAGTVHLAWDGSQGAAGYEIHYGTAPGTYQVAIDTSLATTIIVGDLINGQTYYFAALAYNAEGDESPYSNEVSATPSDPPSQDTTPPTVTLTFPANSAMVVRRSTVTIQAQASDNVGVQQVQITVNGQALCTDMTTPYQCFWMVPAANHRNYDLVAIARDAAGNVTSSAIVRVTAQ